MFSKIQDIVGISFNELVTIISAISVGYLIIYKYSLYFFLDIEWYLPYLSLQEMIFSSLILMALLIVALFVALLTLFISSKIIKNYSHRLNFRFLIIVIYLVVGYVILFIDAEYQKNLLHISYILVCSGLAIFGYITITINVSLKKLLISIGTKAINDRNISDEEKKEYIKKMLDDVDKQELSTKVKEKRRIAIVGIVLISIALPMVQAYEVHKVILKKPERMIPRVQLKENEKNRDWYLLEANKENTLLIDRKGEDGRKYKVVKVDEIKEINIEEKPDSSP